VTLISAVAETCLTRFAALDADAETAAVALVGFTFNRLPPTALMATPAEAEAVSKEPPISAVPDTTIAAVASTERTRLAAAVFDNETLTAAETYLIAAGPTLADAIDAVRFAAGIAPAKTSFAE
jgi:hypothetical protein